MKRSPKLLSLFFAGAILATAVPVSSFAQGATSPSANPASLAAAKELLLATGATKKFDAVISMMNKDMEETFLKQNPGKEAEIKKVMELLPAKLSSGKQELIDQIAAHYATHMTTEELNQLVALFKSPAAVKYLDMQPEFAKESAAIGRKWGAKLGAEVDEEVRKALK